MLIRILATAAIMVSALAATATPSEARVMRYQGRYIWVNPINRVGLNPQPLPPRWTSLRSPGVRVGLNPGIRVGLNPQPLPPRRFLRHR